MLFTVQQLIEGHQEPIKVSPQDSIQKALELMIEYDFSQLPVVDDHKKPFGIITSDSILRALNNFGTSLNELQVSHAIVKVDKYNPGDDLFDLLDDLRDTYAVLIVNSEDELTGIVTSYDTTEYYRRRAEDMMFVEDIETTLKDFIRTAFTTSNGEFDQQASVALVAEANSSNLRKKFQSALAHYLNQHNQGNISIDSDIVTAVFTKHFVGNGTTKSFDDLTLNEYIQLLLHKSKWSYFSPVFSLKEDAIRHLLNSVRKTRNDLAHFHGEISSNQRDQLHFCANWLAQLQSKLTTLYPSNTREEEVTRSRTIPTTADLEDTTQEDTLAPLDEDINPKESRYASLALWLQKQPLNKSVLLTFKEIEEIIDGELPASARQHRTWWANTSAVGHVQSQQWLDADWRVSNVNINEGIITFTPMKEREKAYIDFFNALLSELPDTLFLATKRPSPDGHNWLTIARLPENGQKVASFNFSFSHYQRFRVELYIDSGNTEKNKRIFDALFARKSEIQEDMGDLLENELQWERIDNKRASRIACYHSGAIVLDDTSKVVNEKELIRLRQWATKTMIQFQQVMANAVKQVVNEL